MTLTRTLRKNYGAYNRYVKIANVEHKVLERQSFVYLTKQPDGTYLKFTEREKPNGDLLCFFSEQAASDFVNHSEVSKGKPYPRIPYQNKKWATA